jgi:hypothetical protein
MFEDLSCRSKIHRWGSLIAGFASTGRRLSAAPIRPGMVTTMPTDVDHGSENREPETRTHEQRELNEDSAGLGKH